MKPTFALDLTREEIALLHRTPKGWLSIGEVAFDAPDLAETLDYLRKTALGLSPMGMACKIVLPNSQILYTEVHAPGPSREDKRRQIAAALEGRTPYAVEDLVFDWSGKGQTVKVAVVARETLEEAEGFAVTHRLNPVSFVAVPAGGEFVGEPWFGPTAAAEAILAPGESVDRDREPVAILQRDLASGATPRPEAGEAAEDSAAEAGSDAATQAEPDLTEAPVADAAGVEARAPEDDDPLPGLEEALNADLPLPELPLPELVDPAHVPLPPLGAVDDGLDDLDEAALAAALAGEPPVAPAVAPAPAEQALEATALPDPVLDLAPMPDTPDPALPDPAAVAAPQDPAPPMAFMADPSPAEPDPVTAVPSEPEAADRTPPAKAAEAPEPAPMTEIILAAAEPDEAPFAEVLDALPLAEEASPPQAVEKPANAPAATISVLDDDLPPAPPAAALVAFASRRAAGAARPAAAGAAARPAPAAAPTASAPTPASPIAASPIAASAVSAGPVSASPVAAPAAARAALPPRPTPAPRSFPGLVTAPTIPGTRPRPKGKTGFPEPALAAAVAGGARPVPAKSPARPGGTFGAAPAKNRSGVALLVLVGLLLLFLAAIAAVSSYFLSRNGTPASDSAAFSDPVAVIPGVDDEMLADMQDPEGMTDPLPEADGPALAAGDAGALATESLAEVEAAAPEAASAEVAPVDPVDLAAPATEAAPVAPAAEDAPAAPAVTVIAAPETARAAETAAAPVAETASETAAAPVADAPAEPAPDTVVATDVSAAQAPVEDQDEIFLAAMDAPPPALDALALPTPDPVADSAPPAPLPPPAFGTVYRFDDQGLLVPTPEGILSPEGVMLFAGPPPLVPPARSEVATAAARAAAALAPAPATAGVADALSAAIAETPPEAAPVEAATPADASLVTAAPDAAVAPDAPAAEEAQPAPADPALSGFRPRPRPAGLVPAPDDDAALGGAETSDFATIRPLARPQVVLAAAAAANPEGTLGGATADLGAQAASLTAQAEAELAAAAALEAANPSIVAISRRPEPRPADLSRAVEAAVAAAVREPDPEVVAAAAEPDLKPEEIEELDEAAADAGPSIPTNASVAKQATFKNAINLSKMNLIGTYGTDSRRTALIRQANGRYKKVEVGDKIEGGTIMAITETEVRYQKGGKLLTLAMPKA